MNSDTYSDEPIGASDVDRADDDHLPADEVDEVPDELPIEADEADVIEQSRTVPESEEDYPDV